MKIHLIIAQYKQSYPGQLMPNVVDAWDEFIMEDNPGGYAEALATHVDFIGSGEYEDVKELVVNIPDEAITGLFVTPEINGEVK